MPWTRSGARAPLARQRVTKRLPATCAAVLLRLTTLGVPELGAQDHQDATHTARKAVVTKHARGTFDVNLTPQPADSGAVPARMMIDKRFHGDLEGTSQGQMLAAGTAVKGSAGYVAIERVRGTLNGRTGTFVLQHSGTMDRGTARLIIEVVSIVHSRDAYHG